MFYIQLLRELHSWTEFCWGGEMMVRYCFGSATSGRRLTLGILQGVSDSISLVCSLQSHWVTNKVKV